jgi:DNA-binding NarL/FixJ family response regulator
MHPASALVLLEEAVQVTEGSTARLEHARSLVAVGSAMHRAGRGAEGRDRLQWGLEAASRCGAGPLVEEARAGLLATGARPRRGPLTGPAALTPSERRVADLAAEGRRNREIAQALYVSKTVEVHLTSVYRKLGISTRAELGGALAGASNV